MNIPSQFEVFGVLYTVTRSPVTAEDGDAAWGIHDIGNGIVTVDPNVPDEVALRVFCHEWVHVAFAELGRQKLADDEEIADQLGGLLHQLLKTAKSG